MIEDNKRSECVNGCITLLLRLTVGLVFLTAGWGKIFGHDQEGHLIFGVPGIAASITDQFKNTFLPTFTVQLFSYTLPFAEVIIGALLLAGLFTAETFFAAALLFITLMWGQILLANGEVAGRNALFVLIATLGLRWSTANCCSLDCWRKKKKESSEPVK